MHYELHRPEAFPDGYEHYRTRATTLAAAMASGADRASAAADLLSSVAVIGTPDECLAQLHDISCGLALEHLIGVFQYGTMPRAHGERSLRLFAEQVAPALKRINVAPRVA